MDDLKRQHQKLTDRVFESLDDIKQDVQQDYMTPEEVPVAFKKSKKKKSSKSKRQMSSLDESLELPADHASQDDFMRAAERAEASRIRKKQNFVDDDDLQAALASSRKSVIKKKTAQDIAKELEESRIEEDGLAPVGLVLSETTEFVRNLSTVSQTQLALKDKMQLNLKEELPTVNEEIEAEEEERTMDMDLEETGHVSDDQEKEDEGEKLVGFHIRYVAKYVIQCLGSGHHRRAIGSSRHGCYTFTSETKRISSTAHGGRAQTR